MIEPIKIPKPAHSTGEPEIRELTPEEIQTLEPDFRAEGASLPDLKTATAFGVILDGKIVGYCFAQLKLHVEPTKIEKGYSHLFGRLMRRMEEILYAKCGPVWTYAFVKPGRMAALAESRGMVAEPWCVMSKQIGPRQLPPVELLPVEPSTLDDMVGEGGIQ